jgi:hypothetical protein
MMRIATIAIIRNSQPPISNMVHPHPSNAGTG